MVFLDDWVNVLFVCVVSLHKTHTTTATPSQHNTTWNSHGYSPLEVAALLLRSRTPFSSDVQDHPSGRLIPISSSPRGSEDQERSQRARHENPPPQPNSEPTICSTSSSASLRDLIDPLEICVDDVLPWPSHRSSSGLRNHIAVDDHGDKPKVMRPRSTRWMNKEEVRREEGAHSIQESRAWRWNRM